MSLNPAKILRLGSKGTLKKGADADVTIIDVEQEITVNADNFQSKSKNSPFLGWKLNGCAFMTIVAGKVVMQEGEIR